MRKSNSRTLKYALTVTGLLTLAACNGGLIDPPVETGGDYRLDGVLVVDINRDATHVGARFSFKGSTLSSAVLVMNNDTLGFNDQSYPVDSIHSFQTFSFNTYPPSGYLLKASDSNIFSQSMAVLVVDTFSITNVVPANRLVQGNTNVSVEWNTTANATGFFVVSVHRDSVYSGIGYSGLANAGASAATFPPDAFLSSDGFSPSLGWHYLYIYAFTGSPDSALSRLTLPVPLPVQLADNFAANNITARFGTVTISVFDSVEVVQQP